MNKKCIKIALIGSRDSGKSTLIATIWNSMIHTSNGVFAISDRTPIYLFEADDQYEYENTLNTISIIRHEIIHMLQNVSTTPFLMKKMSRERCITRYNLGFGICNTNKYFEIQLTEISGSMLNNESFYKEHIGNILQDSDTIIIAIDTPFLMHKEEAIRSIGNNISEVFSVLSKLTCSNDVKIQIIFVPLKCEYWVHHGMMNKVFDAVMCEYSTVISMMKQYPGVEISIIPVETVGGIDFYEFHDAYVLINRKNLYVKQCFPLGNNNSMAVLNDGKITKVKDYEEISEDPSAFFPYSNVKRPMQWFQTSGNEKAKYCPQNYEQIILHSMKFVFNSILERQKKSLFMRIIKPSLIGNLTSKDIKQVLSKIEPFIKSDFSIKG